MNKLHNNSIMRARGRLKPAREFRSLLLIGLGFLLLTWPTERASANSSQTKSRSKPQNKPQIKKPSPEPNNKPLPEAVIDNAKFDFGEAFIGEDIIHVFIVRNLGIAPLELSQGGPVAAIERREPDTPFRRVRLAVFNRPPVVGLMPLPAAMRAAPS